MGDAEPTARDIGQDESHSAGPYAADSNLLFSEMFYAI